MTVWPTLRTIEPSKTITPAAVPSSGETNASPEGTLPAVPGLLKSPSSAFDLLPLRPIVMSVPPGAVTLTDEDESSGFFRKKKAKLSEPIIAMVMNAGIGGPWERTASTNDVAAATRTTVLGADAKAKLWTSPRSYLLLQSEWLRLDREEAHLHEGETEPGSHRLTPWGAYAFADYNFALRYNVGASYERWQRTDEDRTWDQAVGLFAGFSLMEETTAFRLGWERFRPGGDEGPAVNTLTLRVIYSMGPHRAHRF